MEVEGKLFAGEGWVDGCRSCLGVVVVLELVTGLWMPW